MIKNKGKYIKNLISSFVIFGIILMPFSSLSTLSKANAQSYGYTTTTGGFQTTGNSVIGLKSFMSGLAPAIANLPLCKADVSQGIKSLFGRKVGAGGGGTPGDSSINIFNPPAGVDTGNIVPNIPTNPYGAMIYTKSNLATNKTSNTFWDKIKNLIGIPIVYAQFAGSDYDSSGDVLNNVISGGSGGGNNFGITPGPTASYPGDPSDAPSSDLRSVNKNAGLKVTGIPVTNQAQNQTEIKIEKNTAATASTLASAAKNDTCWKSIGRLITKMMIQKMTLSTVQWINSGFEGKPAYIQDPKYWTDLTSNEILKFGIEINDPSLYPFGKQFLQNTANSLNNTFTNKARYTLDKVIKDTNPQNSAILFKDDFSKGGWSAWDAMTQIPANNPLGFNLMAANELERRSTAATQAVQNQLLQSGGFLDFKKCVDPAGVSQEENNKAIKERAASPNGPYQYRLCKRSVSVTPGQVVANAAINVANYPQNSLLQAQDLNDALASITDAVLGQFNTVMQKGFASLGDLNGSAGQFYTTEVSAVGSVAGDFDGGQILASTWLQQNPDFNIRTDLTQALVDVQKTYITKLENQNRELFSTIDGKDYKQDYNRDPVSGAATSNSYGLIPTIFQLDYCIPGPHPGWDSDAATQLGNLSNEGISAQKPRMGFLGSPALNTFFAFAPYTSMIPVAGPFISAGLSIVSSISSILNGANQEDAIKNSLNNALKIFTGISSDTGGTPAITDKSILFGDLDSILNRYIDLVNRIYKNDFKPSVYVEAANEYDKVIGYSQMIKDNKATIASVTGVITQMNRIKDEVDALNGRLASAQVDQTAYNEELKTYINAFGRLSANLASGDDIAAADSLSKQIIDEKNYIYNDLLKGPLGCEKDLELNRQNMPEKLYNQQSPTYPAPIFYDYRTIGAGGVIPDPFNSGYINRIYKNVNYGVGYMGFLSSFMVFDAGKAWGTGNEFPVSECYLGAKVMDDKNNIICDHLQIHDLFALDNYDHGQGDITPIPSASSPSENTWGFNLRNFEKTIGIY